MVSVTMTSTTNTTNVIYQTTQAFENLRTQFTSWGAMPPRTEGRDEWHLLLVGALGEDDLDADPSEFVVLFHPGCCHVRMDSRSGISYECMVQGELDNAGYDSFDLEPGLYFVTVYCEPTGQGDWDSGVEQVDAIKFLEENPPPSS